MKRRFACLIALLWLLAPALATAQQAGVKPVVQEEEVKAVLTIDFSPSNEAIYEHVEILRRILTEKLQALEQPADSASSLAFSPDGKHLHASNDSGTWLWDAATGKRLVAFGPNLSLEVIKASPAPQPLDVEGVYLPGQGVVYTLTLHGRALPPQDTAAKPAPAPLSEWERTRKRLRGEKVEPEAKSGPAPAPPLRDLLLKILAENGRHFTHLGEKESLTVVVTFRPPASATQSKDPRAGPDDSRSQEARQTAAQALAEVAAQNQSIRDYVRLAEMHTRQGRNQEAIKALQAALDKRPAPKEAAELAMKLATLYLKENEDARAREVIKSANEFLSRARKTNTNAAETARPTAVPLPAKLIVSAPKKLLDEVGAGKIAFEQFKKGATVLFLPFAPPEKKPAATGGIRQGDSRP